MSAIESLVPAAPLRRMARRLLATLKFRIVALAVATGVLSAVGTTAMLIRTTQKSIERVVLEAAVDDRERAAALLASKVSILRDALTATARQAPTDIWHDPERMDRYLLDQPAIAMMFASFNAITPNGYTFSRVEGGQLSDTLPYVGDREYFAQAMAWDQTVISEVVMGKVRKEPTVIIAVPVTTPDGERHGVMAGSLSVGSTALFQETRTSSSASGGIDLIVDRRGRIIAHPDPARVMQAAASEPGLQAVMTRWLDMGSPIDTVGLATVEGEHLVSLTGIPLTDWMTLRVTPAAAAFAPVGEARATALPAAALAGLVAALVAGITALAMTRPISRLQARAMGLLQDGSGVADWPRDGGEVGDLANAFRHVVEQRERRQAEVKDLLHQIEAVLDHADVGIALTRDGRFELVSRQFCRILRCDKADAVGQPMRGIAASEAVFDAWMEQAQPALRTAGSFDGEVELVRSSGEVFWARLRGRSVVAGDIDQGTIWTLEDVTAAKEQRERLTYSSTHDALTGLLNRAAFEDLLSRATATAAAEPFCALFIDLDRFKQVNDTGGHAAGDALLRGIAQVLARSVRRSDVLARLGGDEFAVLLPSCPQAQALHLAGTLCSAVTEFTLDWEGRCHSVGASLGLVVVSGQQGSAADVLRAADSACYEAKRRGRNRVELFVPSTLDALAAM